MEKKIDPKELIAELSVEELCQTAEEYYASLVDPTFHMAKPFGGVMQAPDLLYHMSLLLSGLRLGQSMTVLDFGAGTCWFSRFLNQMKCITISVDPSETALKIGQELFERLPVIGGSVAPPQFIPFDGHKIDLPDESVDRIICFDVFHHIPNTEEVLGEFYRVLKTGGMIGFCEPGRFHSQSVQSQHEMRNFKVLENDIRLDEIKALAERIGFGDLRIKLIQPHSHDLTYNDYVKMTKWQLLPRKIRPGIVEAMQRTTIFFLTKGTSSYDSRSHIGLGHRIEVLEYTNGRAGEPIQITLRLTNTGITKWLHENIRDIGVVMVGFHLYDADGRLLDLSFGRGRLEAEVLPGQTVVTQVPVVFPQAGTYQLAIDLVSEHVCWFEHLGCQPQTITVEIAEAG